jgi:hypothetical protein
MRKLFLVGVLLALSGCKGVVGPLRPKSPERVDDPLLTIGEQERNGRARLGLPDQSGLSPTTGGTAIPGTYSGSNAAYGR